MIASSEARREGLLIFPRTGRNVEHVDGGPVEEDDKHDHEFDSESQVTSDRPHNGEDEEYQNEHRGVVRCDLEETVVVHGLSH